MIILNEMSRQAVSFKLILTICFHEKSPAILKNIRNQNGAISKEPRFNLYFHDRLYLPRSRFVSLICSRVLSMSSATSFAKYDPLVSLVNALQYKSCASTISCEESWLALQREPLFNLSYNTISESRSLAGVASQYSVVLPTKTGHLI